MGSGGVFTKEEDVAVIKWTLDMQIIHKLTTTEDEGCRVDTKDTQFQDGILGNSWWYWFK